MKWEDTVANRCRYGHLLEKAFPNANVIWERSEDDYQGMVNFIAILP